MTGKTVFVIVHLRVYAVWQAMAAKKRLIAFSYYHKVLHAPHQQTLDVMTHW